MNCNSMILLDMQLAEMKLVINDKHMPIFQKNKNHNISLLVYTLSNIQDYKMLCSHCMIHT